MEKTIYFIREIKFNTPINKYFKVRLKMLFQLDYSAPYLVQVSYREKNLVLFIRKLLLKDFFFIYRLFFVFFIH